MFTYTNHVYRVNYEKLVFSTLSDKLNYEDAFVKKAFEIMVTNEDPYTGISYKSKALVNSDKDRQLYLALHYFRMLFEKCLKINK
jgi:hypothetical protein